METKTDNMESDEGPEQRKNSNIISILGYILQPIGIRCPFKMVNRFNWKLLVFNFYFLPIISILLYFIFLIG